MQYCLFIFILSVYFSAYQATQIIFSRTVYRKDTSGHFIEFHDDDDDGSTDVIVRETHAVRTIHHHVSQQDWTEVPDDHGERPQFRQEIGRCCSDGHEQFLSGGRDHRVRQPSSRAPQVALHDSRQMGLRTRTIEDRSELRARRKTREMKDLAGVSEDDPSCRYVSRSRSLLSPRHFV